MKDSMFLYRIALFCVFAAGGLVCGQEGLADTSKLIDNFSSGGKNKVNLRVRWSL